MRLFHVIERMKNVRYSVIQRGVSPDKVVMSRRDFNEFFDDWQRMDNRLRELHNSGK